VPINALVAVEGTLYGRRDRLKFGNDPHGSYPYYHAETQVRLSAGRMNMSRRSSNVLLQGANSILQETNTTQSDVNEDMKMFEMLGLNPQKHLLKFLNQLQ
jgi:biotin synthase